MFYPACYVLKSGYIIGSIVGPLIPLSFCNSMEMCLGKTVKTLLSHIMIKEL